MLKILMAIITAVTVIAAGSIKSAEGGGTVSADYSPESFPLEADEYNIRDDDSLVRVIFTTSERVTDFKILTLVCETVDENGVTYITDEIYSQEELSPARPLIAGLEFIGDMPNNGISYVDSNGVTRKFSVDMSGKDGSLFLTEF